MLMLVAGLNCFTMPARADLWSTGYYPGYRQNYYPPSSIDFTALSHIIHFAILPNSDGTLNTGVQGINPTFSGDLVARTHAAGRKVLICVPKITDAGPTRNTCTVLGMNPTTAFQAYR